MQTHNQTILTSNSLVEPDPLLL
jgi:hypothetical protein